jgi:hypothetical protein
MKTARLPSGLAPLILGVWLCNDVRPIKAEGMAVPGVPSVIIGQLPGTGVAKIYPPQSGGGTRVELISNFFNPFRRNFGNVSNSLSASHPTPRQLRPSSGEHLFEQI